MPVNERMCCAFWDAEGVEREWEKSNKSLSWSQVKRLAKAAREIICPGCSGVGCDVCDFSGRVQVADDKANGTRMPEDMVHGGIPAGGTY